MSTHFNGLGAPAKTTLAALVCACALLSAGTGPLLAEQAARCEPAGPSSPLPELNEASGIAVSQRVPGRLWTHNDSGQPVLFALDTHGAVTGRVRLTGAPVVDWEAIAVGPCPAGSCIYIGDIGDNSAARKSISVYRFAEPADSPASVKVTDVFHATYPDGAHDAETLLVTPPGDLYIVTKGDTSAVALYKFPHQLTPGATHRLELVGAPRDPGPVSRPERITDGSVSADGKWVVLRTGQRLTFYPSAELLKGNWREERSVDLRSLREVQGEGVAFGANTAVYLAGEGGSKTRPGSFAQLTCTVD
jgi:hypothetical protein